MNIYKHKEKYVEIQNASLNGASALTLITGTKFQESDSISY